MKPFVLLVLAVFFLTASAAHAQTNFWSLSNGPFAGNAEYIVTNSNGDVFASDGSHIFRSTDHGSNWTNLITVYYPNIFDGLAINSSNHLFAAGGNGTLYHSTDNGATWPKIQTPGRNLVSALLINKDILYAVVTDSIFASTNEGSTWTTWAPPFAIGDLITSLTPFNNGVAAAHLISTPSLTNPFYSDIVFTSDKGKTWDSISPPVSPLLIHLLAADGAGTLFGASETALYRWSSSTVSWTQVTLPVSNGVFITGLSTLGGKDLLVTYSPTNTKTNSVILRSKDDGSTFTAFGPSGASAITAVSAGNTIYCGTWDAGVQHSTDAGATWHVGVFGFPFTCYAVANGGQNTIIAGGTSSAFISSDNGANWKHMDGLPSRDVYSLQYSSVGTLHAQTAATSIDGGQWISRDSGLTWSIDTDSLLSYNSVDNLGALYAGSPNFNNPSVRSSDDGKTWMPLRFVNDKENIAFLFATKEGHLFAKSGFRTSTSSDTLWRSTDLGATWADVTPSGQLFGSGFSTFEFGSAEPSGTLFLHRLPYVNDVEMTPALLRSTDGGITWQPTTGLSMKTYLSYIIPAGTGLYAITTTADSSMFQSLDDGKTWQLFVSGLTGVSANDILERSDGTSFVATTYGVYRHPALSNGVKSALASSTDAELRITPNPAGSYITVSSDAPHSEWYSIEIMDLLGRKIEAIPAKGNEWRCDVSQLPDGVYYCIARSSNVQSAARFVVSH